MSGEGPENSTPVVQAAGAKIGKSLMGFVVSYRCPRCSEDLKSWNKAIEAGDACPRCDTRFVFHAAIQKHFFEYEAEKRRQEDRQIAEEEEKRRRRNSDRAQKDVERQQKAAEAGRQREREQRLKLEALAKQARRKKVKHARDIGSASGCMGSILMLGFIVSGVAFVGGVVLFANASNQNNFESSAGLWIAVGFSAILSLSLIYVFFRVLEGIHAMLNLILDQLQSSSKEIDDTP